MKKLIFAVAMFIASQAMAQVAYNQYATTVTLDLPATAATTTCLQIPAGVTTTPYTLKRTFVDAFATFNLKDRIWTPHKDSRYNPTYKQWGGYTSFDTRRQAAMKEQQIYVDPGFMGWDQSPLYLNPFTLNPAGTLTIKAEVTPPQNLTALNNLPFTSGFISTTKSHTQTYGYFEARIKVPYDKGLLPAFWMVPQKPKWPPEFDIMEAPSHKGEIIQTTLHWLGASGTDTPSGCVIPMAGYYKDFHLYGALWTPERVVWYIDRVPVSQIVTPASMNEPMYMQLNLAVGGTWVGNVTTVNAEMVIDAVSAYSETGAAGCTRQVSGELDCK